MATHNQLGKEAEELAVAYLVQHEFSILYRNWRYSHYEIDIVAVKNKLLHIVEVKCLKSDSICYPEEAVTKKKFRFLLQAADEFLFQHPQYRHIQFDILSITLPTGKPPAYFFIEDVFL
jgi:putative endonuclease